LRKWFVLLLFPVLIGCSDSEKKAEEYLDSCPVKIDATVFDHANDRSLYEGEVCLDEGETALDVLESTDLTLTFEGSGEMVYVTAVEGIREKSAGGASGWVYGVNGKPGDVAAGLKVLENGDEVEWRFEKNAMDYFE